MFNQSPAKPGPQPSVPGAGVPQFIPPGVSKVEDTGLSPLWIQDLALKNPVLPGNTPLVSK